MIFKHYVLAIILLGVFYSQFSHGKSIPKEHSKTRELRYVENESSMHPTMPTEPRIGTDELKLERTSDYWLLNGKKFVEAQSKKKLNTNVAKNIIFFLGDGMSIPTLGAVRQYLGGVEKQFSFESFPSVGMAKTYSVDYQVSDSACTATAYLNGVKANMGTIGVSAKVRYSNCNETLDKSSYTTSIAKWAMDAGKWAGLITTARVTHASPAGVYANTASRNWENDDAVKSSGCDANLIDDIAEQLINGDVGSKLRVVLGGGRQEFRNQTTIDEELSFGKRSDGKDLIAEWLNKSNDNRTYVWNATDLKNVDASKTDYLLGLFESSHLKFNLDVVENNLERDEPSLKLMVEKGIEVLSKNEKGYFLFVEGGKIDMAHHAVKAKLSLDETAEFSKAIDYARSVVNEEDTIILVTADHAHTLTYSGYGKRSNNIFGTAGLSYIDKMPYLTLSYANGYGYHDHVNKTGGRVNPSTLNYNDSKFNSPTTVPSYAETHGGDDVTVYTYGPWSHLFTGTYEQNAIPHILAYASCIGDGKKVCDSK